MITGFLQEAKCRYFWRAAIAEVFATLVFVFIISAIPIRSDATASDAHHSHNLTSHNLTSVSLTIGFTAAILVKLFASISGGYFNPAVTVGASVNGEISSLRGTVYAVAQYFGGKSVNS